MSTRDPRETSLRRALREARAEKPPRLDWDAMEERLLRHAQRAAPLASRRSPYRLAWAVLAAAAALVVWLVSERARVSIPQAPPEIIEATQPLRKNGDKLALGSRVKAGEREVSVDHPGRAVWTLAPNSAALLAERGERIVVGLERGSVLSEVVPNPKPEAFVIEAADARVAVHGTVFRVELAHGRLIVNVREGTVAVGARGAVPTFFLKAPAHGEFALDGRTGSIDGRPLGEPTKSQRLTQSKAPPAARGPSAPPSSDDEAGRLPGELPLEPSIDDIENGVARIVDSTSECFSNNTKSAEGVQITVRTALTLQIAASGAVSEIDFQPPLSPEVETCATSSIAHVGFAPSVQGVKVTRMLELKR